MNEITIPLTGSKRDIKAYVRQLPAILTGRASDPQGLGRMFKTLFAVNLFERISRAYAVKASGGTDDLGDKWAPLKRETIAQRPVGRAEKKALGITGRRERGLLTPAENQRWKGIFASVFRRLAPRVGEDEAKKIAARMAWAILKREGAMTKLSVLGGRNVLILRNKDRIFRSLSVGTFLFAGNGAMNYRPGPDQILEIEGGSLVMGSRVPYSGHVHKRRRLWPRSIRKWIVDSLSAAANELKGLV